jgi:ankyrin repeat protein
MSRSLPERPDLDQLRRQAKELRDAAQRGDPEASERFDRHHPSAKRDRVSLAGAQLVIARELGFASWPRLRAAVEATTAMPQGSSAFLDASVDARLRRTAAGIVRADPAIAGRDVRAAVVLGDAEIVRHTLATNPAAAVNVDDERGWPPLLYACYSQWHQIDPERSAGLAEVARLLLDAGASPNTNNGAFRHGYRSALCGAVGVDNPSVVEVLLEAGANPDDGRCIEQAADRHDLGCLELLLARGARVAGTWALGAAVYADDPQAVSLLIGALRSTTEDISGEVTSRLADAAAANASYEIFAALLAAGADPNVRDSDVGLSALRCAVRAGRDETAALLARSGAADDSTEVDRFIGACLAGDRPRAEGLLADQPDLRERFTDDDQSTIVEAAGSRPAQTIALMLDLGFSAHVRNGFGEQPLHGAAYAGNVSVARMLLDAGADVDARDERFEATPLAFATVGSGEQVGKPGEWTETVRLLIEAGASPDDVWVPDKPPSGEVAEALRHYGITPDEADEPPQRSDQGEPGSIGADAMSEVARHLDAAFRDSDLELLGSLLHPDVQWSGCHNKTQALDWFRGFQAEGTLAAVNSVEVDRDAVFLGLSVSRRAEGARPAPPQELYLVFTIDGTEVVNIRAYPDRESALHRT